MSDLNENPYLSARRHYAGLIDASVATVRFWQIFGVGCLLLAAGAGGAAIYMGTQTKYEPVFISVDHLGQTQAVAMVGDGPEVSEEVVIQRQIETWVLNWRKVTSDGTFQKEAIFGVFAMLRDKDPGMKKIKEFYVDSVTSPLERVRVAKETVWPEIITALQKDKTSWRIDWRETTRDLDGALKGNPSQWSVELTLHFLTPEEKKHRLESDVRLNPLGIYVINAEWSRHS